MRLVVISGLSGSGKSIALNVLEDAGYYCVDNLPSWLLQPLVERFEQEHRRNLAVAIDVRGGEDIRRMPEVLQKLASNMLDLRFLFLDAKNETLLQRFAETRRRHPLVTEERTLPEAIAVERDMLKNLAELGHRIDTSDVRPSTLREWVKNFFAVQEHSNATLVFQSFGFKHGLPLDADLVFDARCLPNPFYEPTLRPFTGKDWPVVAFFEKQPDVLDMLTDIECFVRRWLPNYMQDNRSYITVAIGCTGGQHRSVYLVEQLGQRLFEQTAVLTRHREITAK